MRNGKKLLNRTLYYFFQWTLGVIQNTAGGLLCLFLLALNPGREKRLFFGAVTVRWALRSSMALGMFIFMGDGAARPERVIVHEYGHTLQSAFLGPLYLPIVGLPSVLWAGLPVFAKIRRERNISYFSLYCERWANRLGEKATSLPAPEA